MTESERLQIIREISSRLAVEDRPKIDLVLKQFNQPTSESVRGDNSGYVAQMIWSAQDHELFRLAAHLGADAGKIVAQLTVDAPSFWKPAYFRLFISHLATEKAFASDLQLELLKHHISGFVAHRDIEPTKDWQDEIERALSTCDALVALLTPGFHQSKWTDQEVGYALGRGILVVCVRQGQDPYGFIGRLQAVNGTHRKPSQVADDLYNIFAMNKLTQRSMSNAIMARFTSGSSPR